MNKSTKSVPENYEYIKKAVCDETASFFILNTKTFIPPRNTT
ncbi:MAG: hypothetical protein PWQ17_288 [Anaerophaga sp.]|nr:hypothetical protein [Anaerophaga sp.]MDK2840783.1 hypothetical protein [Anaerophaga sp.]MDN5290348.1 hypothetical protein [Anaerophaga sp.]